MLFVRKSTGQILSGSALAIPQDDYFEVTDLTEVAGLPRRYWKADLINERLVVMEPKEREQVDQKRFQQRQATLLQQLDQIDCFSRQDLDNLIILQAVLSCETPFGTITVDGQNITSADEARARIQTILSRRRSHQQHITDAKQSIQSAMEIAELTHLPFTSWQSEHQDADLNSK